MLKEKLQTEIVSAIHLGFINFICVLEGDVNSIFIDLFTEIKKQYPYIELEGITSSNTQLHPMRIKSFIDRRKNKILAQKCDTLVEIDEKERSSKIFYQLKYMISNSDKIILFDNHYEKDTLLLALKYANEWHKKVTIIDISPW